LGKEKKGVFADVAYGVEMVLGWEQCNTNLNKMTGGKEKKGREKERCPYLVKVGKGELLQMNTM